MGTVVYTGIRTWETWILGPALMHFLEVILEKPLTLSRTQVVLLVKHMMSNQVPSSSKILSLNDLLPSKCPRSTGTTRGHSYIVLCC